MWKCQKYYNSKENHVATETAAAAAVPSREQHVQKNDEVSDGMGATVQFKYGTYTNPSLQIWKGI